MTTDSIAKSLKEILESIETLYKNQSMTYLLMLEMIKNRRMILQGTFSPYFTQEPRTKKKIEEMERLYLMLKNDLETLINLWDRLFKENNPQLLLTLQNQMSVILQRVVPNMDKFFNIGDELWAEFLNWKVNVERDMNRS